MLSLGFIIFRSFFDHFIILDKSIRNPKSAGTYSEAGADKCEQCEIGKSCGSDGLTEQMNCTAGWSCENPAAPKKCGLGSYQPLPGQGIFYLK